MIPGLGNLANSTDDKQSTNRIQKFICLMDSMTDQELDSDIKIFRDPKRQQRICNGSGVFPEVLGALLQVGLQFQGMASKMKGMKMDASGMPRDMKDMNKMLEMLPPETRQMLGGTQGLKNLMTQLGDDPMALMQNMQKMA